MSGFNRIEDYQSYWNAMIRLKTDRVFIDPKAVVDKKELLENEIPQNTLATNDVNKTKDFRKK
jgi:hypothetical protein